MKFYKLTAFFLLSTLSFSLYAGDWNTNKSGVVLDGFDVIAYRTTDTALKGDKKYKVRYDGVDFYFSNAENRDLFSKNPKAYAPKYNGFCAFAVGAKNMKVPANADTFKMYNGDLYVFFNDFNEGQKFNTKLPWNKDELNLHAHAELNWSMLKLK